MPPSGSILAPSTFCTPTVNPSHLWHLPLHEPPCVLSSSPWLRLFLEEAPSSRGRASTAVSETAPWLSQVIGLPLPSLSLLSPYFHSLASEPKPPPVHAIPVLPSPSSTGRGVAETTMLCEACAHWAARRVLWDPLGPCIVPAAQPWTLSQSCPWLPLVPKQEACSR